MSRRERWRGRTRSNLHGQSRDRVGPRGHCRRTLRPRRCVFRSTGRGSVPVEARRRTPRRTRTQRNTALPSRLPFRVGCPFGRSLARLASLGCGPETSSAAESRASSVVNGPTEYRFVRGGRTAEQTIVGENGEVQRRVGPLRGEPYESHLSTEATLDPSLEYVT